LLLDALGYPRSEWVYNRGGEGGQKPDYLVKIGEYPRPPIVLEDKNTTIDDLPGFAGRLERYMRAVGALLNGRQLLAYELIKSGTLLLFNIPIADLVEEWRGESLLSAGQSGTKALSRHDLAILRAFFGRFNREAFAGVGRLIDDLIYTRGGELHDEASWPDQSRIVVRTADDTEFVSALINDARALIREVEADTEAQLRLRLGEFDEIEKRLAPSRETLKSGIDSLVTRLNLEGRYITHHA
jgi:hypothetical protein